MNELAVSSNSSVDLADSSNMESQLQDIDKRIRALKKKVYFNPAFFSLL
jgi:partner of Y14 and mago protein